MQATEKPKSADPARTGVGKRVSLKQKSKINSPEILKSADPVETWHCHVFPGENDKMQATEIPKSEDLARTDAGKRVLLRKG